MLCKALIGFAAGAGLLLSAASSPAAELRVNGGAGIGGGIIMPHKAAIEQETGLTLKVTVNGDSNGLKDLSAGRADVAMIGSSLPVMETLINKAAPGTISVADLVATPIKGDSIKFFVHPSNPAKALTAEQIKDIFTGKITSWKEVGGADQPIMVVTGAPGLGARVNVVSTFLGGTEISERAKPMQQLVQVAQVVAQAPTAIGYGNAGSISPAVAVIPGVEVVQTLSLVTKGAPAGDVEKLIAATKKYGAAGK